MIFAIGRRSKNTRGVPQSDASGQTESSHAVENDHGETETQKVDGSAEGRDAEVGLLVGAAIGAVLWLLIYFLFD
jgi:hypothetical protein